MLRKMTLSAVAVMGLLAATAAPAMAQSSKKLRIEIGIGGGGGGGYGGGFGGGIGVGIGGGYGGGIGGGYRPDFDRHYHVQYRVVRWEERVFDSRFAAERFADRLRFEGYLVTIERHRDHYHVRFRTGGDWRTYRTVFSHREAHDLERYLESRGYEARVIHH
jgi:hypothetical protein